MSAVQAALDALRLWSRRIGPVSALESAHRGWAGGEAAVWTAVTVRGERFILKDVAGKPGAGRAESEYRLLRHLEASGVPVAVPIPSDAGELSVKERGSTYLLYPSLPVDDTLPPGGMREVYANVGAALARLHRALAAYSGPVDSWTMDLPRAVFEEAVPRLRTALPASDGERFGRVVAGLRAEMVAALEDLPLQYIHGDCHGGNYLLYRGDVSGFVDLDHVPRGPRVYDLGYLLADHAKARFLGNDAHRGWLADSPWLLVGYERESPLSERERHAIRFVMLATQVLFVDWFLRHGRDELARPNLAAFHWIYRHGGTIARRITGLA